MHSGVGGIPQIVAFTNMFYIIILGKSMSNISSIKSYKLFWQLTKNVQRLQSLT
ncbi:hypothetical protein Celaphus_00003737 [Cervus elaphus hippelaphus]|uniref:Uncharacterized protein n=1 Tax=Cervus elaphus hippelaphus TaxID=46360 RepID=A0A212D2N7_CEREH|nr:hypothetical protein Celaphus_00003737 [Cervus elaphus hippelaphus]